MEKFTISGIQQIGIGVPDVHEGFDWYRKYFGMDIPILDEDSEATQMLPYTGGQGHKRHAILAINLKGGGGFEIWQYKSRTPQPCPFKIQAGDLGIFIAKIKTRDAKETYRALLGGGAKLLSPLTKDPRGKAHFYMEDAYGNIFEVVEFDNWFAGGTHFTGGACGAVIGVSDIARSKKFYSEILGYDTVLFEEETIFEDMKGVPGAENKLHRVLLGHSKPREGSFSRLLGKSCIELIKTESRSPKKIFENRFWGDLGFIHLCFDIKNMKALKSYCAEKGFPFTVESNPDFDMGDAAGQFAYAEDPDGALIEFVEAHKIPIAKKWGWFLDLDKRAPGEALPDWMLKALRFNRVG
jgi:catechol 2,3-dioxygenase-like lactoylglutathione lyase family enzyme